jgi:hypothetical protein
MHFPLNLLSASLKAWICCSLHLTFIASALMAISHIGSSRVWCAHANCIMAQRKYQVKLIFHQLSEYDIAEPCHERALCVATLLLYCCCEKHTCSRGQRATVINLQFIWNWIFSWAADSKVALWIARKLFLLQSNHRRVYVATRMSYLFYFKAPNVFISISHERPHSNYRAKDNYIFCCDNEWT